MRVLSMLSSATLNSPNFAPRGRAREAYMRLSAGRCLVACAAVAATLACYVAFRFTRRVIIDVRSAGVWRPPLSGHDKTRLPERLVRTQPSVHAARCRFARRFASPAHRPLVTMLFIGDSTMRRAFETFCYSLSDGDVFGVLPETNRSSGVFSRQCRGVLGTQRIHAAVTASIVFNSSLVRTWLDLGWQPPTHVYVGSGPWLAWPIRSPFVGLHELAAWPTWWAWKRLEDQLHDTLDTYAADAPAAAIILKTPHPQCEAQMWGMWRKLVFDPSDVDQAKNATASTP